MIYKIILKRVTYPKHGPHHIEEFPPVYLTDLSRPECITDIGHAASRKSPHTYANRFHLEELTHGPQLVYNPDGTICGIKHRMKWDNVGCGSIAAAGPSPRRSGYNNRHNRRRNLWRIITK